MAAPIFLQTGPQKASDGATTMARGDNQGGVVSAEINGKHYENTLRGNMFIYHTTSGAALLLTNTTGNFPTIVNPVGSGYLFVPIALRISFLSGTTTIGSVLLAETLNVGAQIGTASPLPTATFVAAKNALRGSGGVGQSRGSAMLFAPAAVTFTAAPTVVAAAGLNLGTAAPTGTGTYETKLDGALAYPPGTALSVVYSVTTSTALYFVTIWGLELPLPLTA